MCCFGKALFAGIIKDKTTNNDRTEGAVGGENFLHSLTAMSERAM